MSVRVENPSSIAPTFCWWCCAKSCWCSSVGDIAEAGAKARAGAGAGAGAGQEQEQEQEQGRSRSRAGAGPGIEA